jgi:hypothetical protein
MAHAMDRGGAYQLAHAGWECSGAYGPARAMGCSGAFGLARAVVDHRGAFRVARVGGVGVRSVVVIGRGRVRWQVVGVGVFDHCTVWDWWFQCFLLWDGGWCG